MTLLAGTKLGPYEILAPVGAGGMGEVYRARDTRLGRDVAIKVLPASFSQDADRLRRFEQEARAASLLNHPNITVIYDIGRNESDGAPYVVEELLEGETLRAALAGDRLAPRRAIEYALQIAHGLAAAHEKGIVHRDLKPENLFVTRDGRVKILDFGLAKLVHAEEGSDRQTNLPTASAGTEPGVVMGTLGYMSPEQIRGNPADTRSDIFSFGAILYEMLCGRRAFRGDSAADTMSAILKEDPPDPSTTNQAITPGLERIVRHCLEKNPEERFQSARDLAFDLQSGSDRPESSGTTSAHPEAAPAHRWTFLASAILFITLTIVLTIFLTERFTASGTDGAPVFHRVTFRRGYIDRARLAPDGQSIVYSAAWDGLPLELFATREGSNESRSLTLRKADVLSISPTGEMALLLIRLSGVPDMLARLSLEGGAPKDVLEGVIDADWAPDGKKLAVIRSASGTRKLEFPVGKMLLESEGLYQLRVSPDGRRIAVGDGEGAGAGAGIAVVDDTGKKKSLFGGSLGGSGLAWLPSGREIWFTQAVGVGPPSLWAVTLSGHLRPVYRSPNWLRLCDIAPDGRVLMTAGTWRGSLNWLRGGDARERDVSWLDSSRPADLSGDGKALLFDEPREGGLPDGLVFLRQDPSQPALRIGEGHALSLSPDAKWAISLLLSKPGRKARLVLLPTGAGEQRTLPTEGIEHVYGAQFLSDGKRFAFRGEEKNKKARIYIEELEGGRPHAITPEGVETNWVISSDGQRLATRIDHEIQILSIGSGRGRRLDGQQPGDVPIQWCEDGRSIYVYRPGEPPVEIDKLDVASGRREAWKTIAPVDAAGIRDIRGLRITPDGKSYAYMQDRRFDDLYIVKGLK